MTCSRFRTTLIYSTLVLFAGMPLFAQGGERTGPDQGAQLYGMNCAYCHGAGGQGGRATALTGPNVIALSDQDLIGIVHNGEAAQGMPAFPHLDDDETQALVRYLRTVQGVTGAATVAQLPGDPNAGRELFFGKGQCSTCHMIDGQGGFMAPELTAYAQYRTAGDIVQAIVNPDANLGPASRVAEVRTRGGQRLIGIVRAEDNMNIILQTEDGRYHFLMRNSLAAINYTGHSLMPNDYGARLTAKDLDDLVSFLIVTDRNAPVEARATRRRRGDN